MGIAGKRKFIMDAIGYGVLLLDFKNFGSSSCNEHLHQLFPFYYFLIDCFQTMVLVSL